LGVDPIEHLRRNEYRHPFHWQWPLMCLAYYRKAHARCMLL
jgi:hypothetical protein